MTSKDHLNNQQLAMFMPAKELMNSLNESEQLTYVDDNHKDSGRNYSLYTLLSTHDSEWRTETKEDMVDRKLKETKRTGGPRADLEDGESNEDEWYTANTSDTLYRSIARDGVAEPVLMEGDKLSQGHHRVIAANDVNPNMEVPVQYDE